MNDEPKVEVLINPKSRFKQWGGTQYLTNNHGDSTDSTNHKSTRDVLSHNIYNNMKFTDDSTNDPNDDHL